MRLEPILVSPEVRLNEFMASMAIWDSVVSVTEMADGEFSI